MKKFTLIGAVFLLILGCGTLAEKRGRTLSSDEQEMEYVEICENAFRCKKFSRLIMGTDHLAHGGWTLTHAPEMNEEQIREVLTEAARLGINLFDTSPIYVGGIERTLGLWLKTENEKVRTPGYYANSKTNPDRKLYALSKGGFPFDLYNSQKLEAGTHSPQLRTRLSREKILSPFTSPMSHQTKLTGVPPGTYASRLFGDREQITTRVSEELFHSHAQLNGEVAVYLMHRDDHDYFKFNPVARPQTPVQIILEALSAPPLAQNYELLGWSNWSTARVNESVRLTEKNPYLRRPVLNSPYFSLFEMSSRTIHAGGVQTTHAEMSDPSFQAGIKLMTYSPLGGFSILDQPEPRWANAKALAKKKFLAGDTYWKNVYPAIFTAANKARFDRVEKFLKLFNEKNQTNYTLDQMINAYALAHARTDFLTIGPITVTQLRRTVAALKLARLLKPEDLEFIYSGQKIPAAN